MMRHLLWFVLVLSLLFNVFFAVGYVKTQRELASAGGASGEVAARVDDADRATRRVAEELKLDDEQKEVFARLRASLAEDHAALRESFQRTEQDIRETLDAPAFDLTRFEELMNRRADLHRQRMLMASDRFSEFVAVLTPEQCREVARRFAREGRRGGRAGSGGPGGPNGPDGRWRAIVKTFDANGDGRLDDDERAAAEQHMEKRRLERWSEILERFDADANGELDPPEREAWRRSRLGHGPDGDDDGDPHGRGAPMPPPDGD